MHPRVMEEKKIEDAEPGFSTEKKNVLESMFIGLEVSQW